MQAPTSRVGSNIFFNNRHSLGLPIVSIIGMPFVGSCTPAGSPGMVEIEAGIVGGTRDGNEGATPRIGAVEAVRPVLLLAGMPTEPAILQ